MSDSSSTVSILNDEELQKRLAEGELDLDWPLSLKSNWILRPDATMVLLVEIIDKIFEQGKYFKLYPQIAITIGLMDGNKTLREIIDEASKLFEVTSQTVINSLKCIIREAHEAFTLNVESTNKRKYDFNKFVIPSEKIDLNPFRLSAPTSLILHIADACNRNCIYCNVEKRPTNKKTALSTEQLYSVIDQAAEIGILTVSIAGGEPFLRNDIPEIIERIYKNNMECGFSTKAYISPEMAERLKEAGVRYAQVSIDAPEEKIADLLVGSVGFYKDAIASIKNFRQAGIQVRTNSMITPFNLDMVEELVGLLVSLGVYETAITTPSRSLHNGAVSDALFLNQRDGKCLEDKTMRLQKKYESSRTYIKPFEYSMDYSFERNIDRKEQYINRSYCSAGRTALLVLEDGKVVLCEECPVVDELVFGNVKEQSLQEIWNSKRIDEFLYPPREKYSGTVCYDCEDYDDCHKGKGRCWRESLKAYGRIYAPAPLCPYAPVGKRTM